MNFLQPPLNVIFSASTIQIKAKIERVQMQIRQAEQDYKGACDKLTDIFVTWRTDMTSCCVVC